MVVYSRMKPQKNNVRTCKKCNYTWITKSNLLKVTCPSCSLKTPNREKIYIKKENSTPEERAKAWEDIKESWLRKK